jgi:FAD/FMN-containing dehydrogenase
MTDTKAVSSLKGSLRGQLIQRGDDGYAAACKVYNAAIEKSPLLVARCADVADVMAGVNFARQEGLLLAVRGGGHNGAGLGTCDGGLVLDLSQMKGIRVAPEAHTVCVEGGATWGAVEDRKSVV